MDVKVFPSQLKGTVALPSSKSLTHRALICAALAVGTSRIRYPLYCDDTIATIQCLKALGVTIEEEAEEIIVKSSGKLKVCGRLDVIDSASTLRLLVPVVMHFQSKARIFASNRLIERLQTPDLESLIGLKFTFGVDYLEVEGVLEDRIALSEELTTQWISGMLLALPLKPRTLLVDSAKSDYIRLTSAMMEEFGVRVTFASNTFTTLDMYQESFVKIEGDWSNASFFLNMASFNPITIQRINEDSLQGDKIYPYFIDQIKKSKGSVELSLEYYPDLAIPLACFASVSGKIVIIKNLKKLALKESNRMESVFDVLSSLGATIAMMEDSLIIEGMDSLVGGCVLDSYLDHRIVMGVISIASRIKNPFEIRRAEAVRKSFPTFFTVTERLGAKYEFQV